ncbi:MAG: hypothetical protein HN837_07870, partial [Chloroflexi bacterium]|nr:hypothetical protein [Chloroflexota bacterium]
QIENHNNNIIRVVDSDGSNLIAIDDAQRYGFESAWSPDSGKIAYIKSDNDSGGDISDIYIANADGTGRINITNGDYGRAMRVSWSSDGQKITFQALSSASQMDPPDSYRVNADGTGLTKTTSTINGESAYEIMPSPDGKRTLLAVIDDETTTEYLIYLADADGRNPVRIMENVQEYISGYTWAPNSSKFAYSTRGHDVDNPDGRDTNAHNIYVVNADGTGLVELASVTTDGNSYSSGPGWFVWSPDSTRIIFPNTIDDNLDIFSVRADGTGLVNITNSPGSDWGPILPR